MEANILARYEQAQELMQGVMTNRIVTNDAVFPHWIGDSNCFWYRRETKKGHEFRLVDSQTTSNTPAFDHKALADALFQTTRQSIDHQNLPIKNVTITVSPLQVQFQAFEKSWLYESNNTHCVESEIAKTEGLCSPDGKMTAFVHEYNIWIRNERTGEERALTQDGKADLHYGSIHTPMANPSASAPCTVQAIWSPDSKYLLTHKLDTRQVVSRPIVQYTPCDGSLHPKLIQYKNAYPGDKHVETYQLVAIDISTNKTIPADYDPLPFFNMGEGFFTDENLGWWSPDSRRAYFIDVKRGAKSVSVIEFDTHTGGTRVLLEETSTTYVKLFHTLGQKPLFFPLPKNDELIWFSERTGYGHLYLYDLNTGELKHPITEGQWVVRDILHYQANEREILLQTSARDSNISPHYRDICRINIDTGVLTTLVSGNFEHVVYRPFSPHVMARQETGLDSTDVNGVSPNGEYVVTTRSRVDTAPVSVLINRKGKEILTLEVADVSGLPTNWNWPEPIEFKGADDQTNIYGIIFRPPGFSPDERYPVLDFSCSSRIVSLIPQGSFVNGPCFDYYYLLGSALAALGFIVVAMEARGTPNRTKAFQDYNYGDISSSCDFEDRITGLQQLASKYPYMDIERVGLTGGDGLSGPVYGLLNHPEFYKVAVLHCFFELRFSSAALCEQREGVSNDEGSMPNTRYAEDNVESLSGKLLLIQGMLDPGVPSSTFRLVDALQKANKDFDMLCLTNEGHSVPTYALRRNWDYLVKHLQGIEPPKEFQLTTGLDLLGIFH